MLPSTHDADDELASFEDDMLLPPRETPSSRDGGATVNAESITSIPNSLGFPLTRKHPRVAEMTVDFVTSGTRTSYPLRGCQTAKRYVPATELALVLPTRSNGRSRVSRRMSDIVRSISYSSCLGSLRVAGG